MRWAPWLLAMSMVVAVSGRSQGTRDMDLGGAIMPDVEAGPSVEERSADYFEPVDEVEALPVEERPAPKKEEQEYIPFMWERATAYHSKGHYPEACADFDTLADAGEDLAAKKAVVGRTYLACARLAAESKDLDRAKAQLDKARTFLGEVPEMRRVYGAIARHRSEDALAAGNLDEAIEQFEEARKQEPDATDPLKFSADMTYRARTAYDQGDLALAKKALTAALQAFPDSREAKDLEQEIWLQENLILMVAAGFAVVALVVVLGLLWRRSRRNQYEKTAMRDDLPDFSPDELEGVDDEDDV